MKQMNHDDFNLAIRLDLDSILENKLSKNLQDKMMMKLIFQHELVKDENHEHL